MTTITKERLLTIKQWRETYGPGSNVVLPAEKRKNWHGLRWHHWNANRFATSMPNGLTPHLAALAPLVR